MPTKQLTGEQRFLRFAWPCAEERLRRKLITREQFDDLRALVIGNGQPERKFLADCFPGAVKRLLESAGGNEELAWSYEHVGPFWHEHRGIEGRHCDTLRTIVSAVSPSNGCWVRTCDGVIPALNPYWLTLAAGTPVFVHQQMVIEKIES